MAFESQSFDHNEPDPQSFAESAKNKVESNTDIGSERIDEFFRKCVQAKGEYYVIRAKNESGETINRHLPKEQEMPTEKDSAQIIADLAEQTLNQVADIDALIAEDIHYHPEQNG